MTTFLQLLGAIFTNSGQYFLVALGWVLLYKGTRILNFANGQVYFLGAAVYIGVGTSIHSRYLAVALGVVVAGLVGALTYRFLLRRLAGRSEFSAAILTFGVAIILEQILAITWGSGTRAGIPLVRNVVLIRADGVPLLTTPAFVALCAGTAVLIVTSLITTRSQPGLRTAAAGDRPWLASISGINISRIGMTVWFLGSASVGLGAILLASTTVVDSTFSDIGLLGIAPALIGGLDSIIGAAIGSVVVAALEFISARYLGGAYEDTTVYALLLVVLLIRPSGLLGSRDIVRA